MRTTRRHRLLATIVTLAIVVVAGCGSEDPVCESLSELQASIAALGDLDIDQGALAAIQAAVGDIEDDVASVRVDADEELGDEVGTLESAVRELAGSVSTAIEAPGAGSVAAVATEVADTQRAWESLVGAAPGCDL